MMDTQRREGHRTAPEKRRREALSQTGGDNRGAPPLCGRGCPGRRWWGVAPDESKNDADEVLGRPGRKRDAPAGFEDAAHLRHRYLGPGCEYVTELAQDYVERRVRKR